ncbi:MAG: T9SS type A sorting domain-containing protein [Candidatus Eisenbacteria bacterium]|nr:T9SS type A sorting domain-containing protein [Candidatus Eisenbacteria bacterium]
MRLAILPAILCVAFLSLPAAAVTIHVPDDYPLIMDAMVFADPGDTVLVECGIYYECGIQMKPGVTLLSETGEQNCAYIGAQNLGRVINCVDCGDSTAIIGFILAGGRVTSGYGAGIACTNSSPRLENLKIVMGTIDSPTSPGGAGLGCVDSSPTLTNVRIENCTLQESTVGGGGGMMTAGQSSPTLNGVHFEMNWTTDAPGGAMSVQGYGGQIVTLNDVTFYNNSATSGGGLHVSGSTTVLNAAVFDSNWAYDGGGVHLETCRPCTLRGVTFEKNTAATGKGGGLLCQMAPAGTATLENLTFLNNTAVEGGGMACDTSTMPTVSYATFIGNAADRGGGLDVASSPVKMEHASFYANEASNGGGVYVDGASTLDLDASIVSFSTDGEGIGAWGYTPPVITCTDIYGNAGGDWVGSIAPFLGENGNISLDPLFCDAANGDLTLAGDSPCLPQHNTCGVLYGAHGQGCPPSTDVPEHNETGVFVHPASPNPFGRTTALSYRLPAVSEVDIAVFDASGRLVRKLVDSQRQEAGARTTVWNGRDAWGRPVASGVYFLRVDAGGSAITRRAVLLR